MDISRDGIPDYSRSSSYESRKRKLTQSVLYEGSSEMDRGRASGPMKRRERKYDGETMRGRTKQRGIGAPHRAERRNLRSARQA